MPDPEDANLIAQLIGTTSAHMKNLDEEIVSSSANLQKSADNWNPHEILKSAVSDSGLVPPASVPVDPYGGNPSPPPPGPPPAGVHPGVGPLPVAHPYAQPVNQPVVQVVTREFEVRLEQVEEKLDTILEYIKNSKKLDEKISSFVDRGLKDKVKQITLKLDDTKD